MPCGGLTETDLGLGVLYQLIKKNNYIIIFFFLIVHHASNSELTGINWNLIIWSRSDKCLLKGLFWIMVDVMNRSLLQSIIQIVFAAVLLFKQHYVSFRSGVSTPAGWCWTVYLYLLPWWRTALSYRLRWLNFVVFFCFAFRPKQTTLAKPCRCHRNTSMVGRVIVRMRQFLYLKNCFCFFFWSFVMFSFFYCDCSTGPHPVWLLLLTHIA